MQWHDEEQPEYFLLDTNVVSEMMGIKPPNPLVIKWMDIYSISKAYISVITIGEIRKGASLLPHSKKRMVLESWLHHNLPQDYKGRILSVDDKIADCWGELMAEYKHIHNPVDMMFAATAIVHDMTFVTRNEKHFKIRGLRMMNPWTE